MEIVTDFILGGSKITVDGDCSHEIKRCSLENNYDQPREHIKKQRHYFADKGPSSQSDGFSGSHVQFSSVAQSRPTLCDPMNRSMPGLPG